VVGLQIRATFYIKSRIYSFTYHHHNNQKAIAGHMIYTSYGRFQLKQYKILKSQINLYLSLEGIYS